MAVKKYSLTDEHRAQLGPWRDQWIANAMSTKPMDDADREATRVAIRGLYEAAGLTPPPDHRIVFVPSPLVMRFAGGFAAWIWWLRKNAKPATRAATDAATYAATRDATDDVTYDATWYRLPLRAMTALARELFGAGARAGLECACNTYRMWNGGNQYSAWVSYLSFFRHVAQLPLDYAKWQHYEAAAIHAGPRIMHAEFCIVSDRPEVLKVDDQYRPHCDDGPFCRWRDGTALYAVHGTRVPWDIIERPESVTVERIKNEGNAEVRRAMIARMGAEQYVKALGASKVQADDYGELYRVAREGDSDLVMVRCWNSTPEKDGTTKEYWLRVHPDSQSAREGLARMIGLRKAQEYAPAVET